MISVNDINNNYPRDLIGYGRSIPSFEWPQNARIAVQFVINYEEGGESCILHGDSESESFLSDIIAATPLKGQRHMSIESMYEYGSRAGFWRLHRLFSECKLPVTVFGVAMALARNPDVVTAALEENWEIASHGYRWIDYQNIDIQVERQHMQTAVEIHTQLTGQHPAGWYTGRTSPNTQSLVIESGEFLYDSDSYADDLPFWVEGKDKPHLVIPYSLETNDMRFVTNQGFNSGDQFFAYLRDTFDILYEEGKEQPKMMSVGLHCRLVGRPGRIASLIRFLAYIQKHKNVWICRRDEIARHWCQNYSPVSVTDSSSKDGN